MKSEGKRMTLQEFEPECDDQDNAALLWRGAEAMFSIEFDDKKVLSKAIEDIFFGRPIDENTRKQLKEIRAMNQNVLQLVREAVAKPCFKYVKNWDGPDVEFDILNLVKKISIVHLWGIDAVLKAEDGQLDEAIEQCCSGMRFLRSLLDEPFLINYLVNMANMKQLNVCLNKITAGKKIKTATLLNILKELDTKPWRKGLIWSFETEKISRFNIVIRFLRKDKPIIGASFPYFFADKMYYWLFRPVMKTEITQLLELWEEMEKAAQFPYYETKETRDMCERKKNNIPWYFKINGFIFPNVVTVMFKEATLEATLLSAQIGVACKIYKNQHGEFPEKLSQLVPDILKKEPVDPFTGESFVYRKRDTGFIVYSLGSNERDDGGRGTRSITSIVMEKDDDWAWKEEMN